MSTKVKRLRPKIEEPLIKLFSKSPITMMAVDTPSVKATAALKQEIEIVYDKNGHIVSPTSVNLGMQYDNRVTGLKFNFEQLLWHDETSPSDDYDIENRYDKYEFKIYFKREGLETAVYEIDPREVFEVPRHLTQHSGSYQLVVSIRDIEGDNGPGNTDKIEVFITDSVNCEVQSTGYDPSGELIVKLGDTNQLKSLTKMPLTGELTDDGFFLLDSSDLGHARDNYVKYLRFDLSRITAHISNLHTIAIFYNENTKRYYVSLLEHINPNDIYDDNYQNHPYIAGVPSTIYEEASQGQILLLSFAGEVGKETLDDSEYYFYVSTSVHGVVHPSLVTTEDLNAVPLNSSNFELQDGSTLYTNNNEIFNVTEAIQYGEKIYK